MATNDEQLSVTAAPFDSLLSGVLASSSDGIVSLSPVHDQAGHIIDFTFTMLNPVAEEIARRTSEQLVGTRLNVEMPRNLEASLFEKYAQVVTTGTACDTRFRYDRDGHERWLHAKVIRIADGIVVTFRDVTEMMRLQSTLAHQVGHDPLTGLANRALLEDRISHALAGLTRRPSSITLLFLDLDRFKLVNDGLGHAAGDALLVQFADRVRSSIRPTDTLARLGGDEFVILVDAIEPDDLAQVTSRILATANEPYCVGDRDVFLAVTIGVTQTITSDTTPSDLIAEADRAKSKAKQLGGNRIGFADRASPKTSKDRLDLEVQLHRALKSNELRLAYQPVVDCRTGLIAGAEALIRWEHPTRGMVQPDHFLPIAEATGLIRPIGDWVIHEATQQLARWSALPLGGLEPVMAVNASADQLTGTEFPVQIHQALTNSDISPHRLCVEVTETALIRDPSTARSTLDEISRLGVLIALDDFGTGYSPLTYLQQFPVDTIKIDRSFISHADVSPEDAALVTAVIDFATALDKSVTAEGIETVEQLELVQTAHHYQGYLFSRPIWADEFAVLLERQAASTSTSTPS